MNQREIKIPKMPKSLKKKLIKMERWKARQKKKGIKTDFGKGLTICLIKFAGHFDNDYWKRIFWVDAFYHGKLKGNKEKLKDYDINFQRAVEYAEITMHIRKTPEKWIAKEIEMWANGASDHLYGIKVPKKWERTKIAKKVKELQDLGLTMGHGFTNKSWTVKDLQKLRDLTEEISLLLDKKIGLKSDKGIYG